MDYVATHIPNKRFAIVILFLIPSKIITPTECGKPERCVCVCACFVPDRITVELENRLHVLIQKHVVRQGNVRVMGGVEVCDTAGGDA